ncbi:MFS transporter [Brevibacterium sp. UCMA 11754]|uniref:MFS transporter n=1 Tax=Brevibacterium sp. UCMA 11754 TaxID=2749198 RepID=UPI001F171A3A|nr:MFS transporter [Brevibacterium sp. UCMA 11754]MCF2571144.1 MFS transporter [Brevibacterium sp. UCMA 11754]
MRIPKRWIVLIGSFLAYMFDALELSILSLALPAMRTDLGIDVVQGGWLATVTLLGIGVSSVTIGRLADRYGRKRALVWSLSIFGTLTALVFFAPNFTTILILRFLSGLGLGGVWAIVSTYVVETWAPAKRGRAVAFVLSSFAIGGLLAALIANIGGTDWRIMFLIAGLSAVVPVLFCGLLFTESEAWLASSAGQRRNSPTHESAPELKYRFRDLFGRRYARNTVVGTLVCAFALLGFWGASAWLPTFLAEERGVPGDTVAVFVAVLNIGLFVGYNAFGLIADYIGRKRALMISLIGVGVVLPLYAFTADETTLLVLGPAYAFFAVFTGILGSYLGELFPTELRATGVGFAFNIGRGISALAPLLLGYIAAGHGFGFGFIICGLCFLASGVLVCFLPNTFTRRDRKSNSVRDVGLNEEKGTVLS